MTAHRTTWIAALAKLVTPLDPERAAVAMTEYLPFLRDLPDAAFTWASLHHVAMHPRRLMVPDLSEILRPLTDHWRRNRPHRDALPVPAAHAETAPAEARCTPEKPLAEYAAHLAKKFGYRMKGFELAAPTSAEPSPKPPIPASFLPAESLAAARAANPIVQAARAAAAKESTQ